MFLKLFIVACLTSYAAHGNENSTVISSIPTTTPCPFNSLCRCISNQSTHGIPVYKSLQVFNQVHCNEVPFTKLPGIPGSNVTELSIVGSGLEVLGDGSLSELNLRTLNLANNRLLVIEPHAFIHSKNTLEALDISYNNLQAIPEEAINKLSRLKMLSVERNEISSLLSVAWGNLTSTLEFLFLGGNHLFSLPLKLGHSLMEFRKLISLKIDGNYLTSLPENSAPFSVVTLSASGNHIEDFPSSLIARLQDLKNLYLADNNMETLPALPKNAKLKELTVLDLSNNVIKQVENVLGKNLKVYELDLSHNKIASVVPKAFNGLTCQKLNLSYNKLVLMHERALYGLSQSLEEIDMSSNSFTKLPKALMSVKKLKNVSLKNNNIFNLPDAALKNSSSSLTRLDLSHNNFQNFPKHTMYNLRRLEHLDFGYNHIIDTGFGFSRWAQNLRFLSLESNQLGELQTNAFKHANQLITLKLSFNKLTKISEKAFASLDNLAMLDLGFSLKNMSFPENALAPLKRLRDLHLDNNNIKELPVKGLGSRQLRYVNLQFNKVVALPPNFFRPSTHKELEEIRLAFNKLATLESLTFGNLQKLKLVDVSYNAIHSLLPESFKNLPSTIAIVLSHNVIVNIHNRTFINLPSLIELDLHSNELKEINWHMFHNVSNSMHPMTLNLSRNRIDNSWYDLRSTPSWSLFLPDIHIMNIDLSHNEYKEVPYVTLSALNHSLKIINLGYNHIKSLHDLAFANLAKVEVVNMEHNIISELNETSFRGLKNVQMVDLSHNHISRIFTEQFAHLERLRVLDLSYNHISTLPGDCFKRTKIERLLLKGNAFVNVPLQSLLPIGHTLGVLDLSYNRIENMDADQFATSPLLTDLNLCFNSLTTLRDNVFRNLNSLIRLQLCGNRMGPSLQTFYHNVSLQHLNLADTGLNKMPFIAQENLISLNFSGNNITELKQNFLFGVPKLKKLDLSRNNLTNWSNAGWVNARHLAELDISSNPIKILTRENFDGLSNLLSLNLQHLNKLERFDADSLVSCPQLVSLKAQTWPNIEKYRFRLPAVLATLKYLRKLSVHVVERKLTDQLADAFSKKIRVFEITGSSLQEIGADALKGLDPSKELLLRISGTNLTTLPPNFFYKLNLERLTVDLRGNSFSTLPPATFYINEESAIRKSGTHKYQGGIWVQNNPLRCGCQADWLGRWMRRYYKEVLRGDTKKYIYGREVLESMWQAECIEPKTGSRAKILTYEMLDCHTGFGSHLQASGVLMVAATVLVWAHNLL